MATKKKVADTADAFAKKVTTATSILRVKGYKAEAIDLSAAIDLSQNELVLGLIGIINSMARRISALEENKRAVEHLARHGGKK